MTPTLSGRWQIRIFLLPTIGLVISLIVSLIVQSAVPLFVLLYVLLFGLLWDVLYQFITSYRWDRDWPTSFQVAAGVIEGALIWLLILTGKLPGIPQPPPFIVFLIQYGIIWLSIFVLVQGPLRVIWLKWRYQGGQWFVSHRPHAAGISYQQQPAPVPQSVGSNHSQQPPPQLELIRSNNPRRQDTGDQKTFVCACGFASDREAANFCPRCGRPQVQRSVS